MSIEQLTGKRIVEINGAKHGNKSIEFRCDGGLVFRMFHLQDCCESVEVDDVVGDLSDLIGHVVVEAYEESNRHLPAKVEGEDSWTWTFYRIATDAGVVTIKWYGCSNGCYSESVEFEQVSPGTPG